MSLLHFLSFQGSGLWKPALLCEPTHICIPEVRKKTSVEDPGTRPKPSVLVVAPWESLAPRSGTENFLPMLGGSSDLLSPDEADKRQTSVLGLSMSCFSQLEAATFWSMEVSPGTLLPHTSLGAQSASVTDAFGAGTKIQTLVQAGRSLVPVAFPPRNPTKSLPGVTSFGYRGGLLPSSCTS